MKKQEIITQILKILPLSPQSMTTVILKERLSIFFEKGTDSRTISRRLQRYLLELYDQNLVDCSMSKPYSWSKKRNWISQTLNSEAIIAFQLAEQQLRDFPDFIKSYIAPWFQTAKGEFAELSTEEKRFYEKLESPPNTSLLFQIRYIGIFGENLESIKGNKQVK